jgi:chromosome segregation ATPase
LTLANSTSTAIFIAVCQAPGLALVSAVLVLFVRATQEYQALATRTQETQAKYEATIAELRKQLSTLEAELQSMRAQNRVLMGEKERIQETHTKSETAIVELQKQSSTLEAELQSTSARNRVLTAENEKMQETQGKSEITIAGLQKQLSTLKEELQSTTNWNHALIGETKEYMTQIAANTRTREALSLEAIQAKANALALQQELEAKTKEAKDWKDLFLRSSTSPTHRQAIQRGDTASVSVAGIIADKDQIIKELRDRLTECYSQLTSTLIPGAATL